MTRHQQVDYLPDPSLWLTTTAERITGSSVEKFDNLNMGHQLAHRKSLTPWTVSLPFAQQIKDAFSAATDAYQSAPALVHELDKLARLATANHHQIAGSWPDSLLAAFTFLTSPGEAYAVTR